jgi:uncharacterized peroxidase-related enzyme
MSFLREVPLDENEFPPFANARSAFGFVPNFYRAQTLRPDLIEAETGLVGSILLKEGALSRAQKEYIFLVCSAANLSTYCVTAHCEIVRALGLSGPEPEKIAVDHLHADIPIADKALLNFVLKLNGQATKVRREDIEGLRTYGFRDEQILEAVVLTGLARFANLISAGLGAETDFEPNTRALPRE